MPRTLLPPQATPSPEFLPHQVVHHEPRWHPPETVLEVPLSRMVEHRLANSGYQPLRHIQVMLIDGRIRLLGYLPTYFLKQMAQETAAATPGVCQVENQVQVHKRN